MSGVKTLATLGPLGSDSERAARVISVQMELGASIVLMDSFSAALRHASENNGLALIPAAYQEKDEAGSTRKSWADTHFQIEVEGSLELWASRVLPLKDFALARREEIDVPATVSLHAAMSYYAQRYLPRAASRYHRSKPEAVRACSQGVSDACFGSLDEIRKYPNLVVMQTFRARMCWTLYRRRPSSFS